MINFKILRYEPGNKMVQVRYSKEGKPDYFVRSYIAGDWTEENIRNEAMAEQNVEQATQYWSTMDHSDEVVLSSDSGQVKDRLYEAHPEFNPNTQVLVRQVAESDTTMTYSYVVRNLTEEEIAGKIRDQRNKLLLITDAEMVSDRNPSQEMIDYRQALRDLPQQPGFPTDIQWPMRPIE